jgi:hypothetical protein
VKPSPDVGPDVLAAFDASCDALAGALARCIKPLVAGNKTLQFYCAQTRRWVDTYAPMGHTLRFKPVGYVAKGDKIHKGMQGYAKAQCMLFERGESEESNIDSMDYVGILRLCARVTFDGFAKQRKKE